jgi:hypothetical protein
MESNAAQQNLPPIICPAVLQLELCRRHPQLGFRQVNLSAVIQLKKKRGEKT